MQLAHQIKIVSVFSCYGNSILYNEIVEIGGYTIQLYYKFEQPFRSYCHKNIGIFVYKPMGGVQLLYTKMGYPFIFNGGLQIFKYL